MLKTLHVIASKIFKNLSGSLQWRALWLAHDKFMVGVTGVVLDNQHRILLLKHRYWSRASWGLPSGYIRKNETVEDAFAREVREETGVEVFNVKVVRVRSGFRLRIEVAVTAEADESAVTVHKGEVLEGAFLARNNLPLNAVLPEHLELIDQATRGS
ncbi:MAG TPA: NUDIX hydrolase [Thermoanaerobaculia bacterium]|nr:NUDIX hydrolase [Thermoanaerobaculia bacterium]